MAETISLNKDENIYFEYPLIICISVVLRGMVSQGDQGVDFAICKKIRPSELICPVDLHVARVARRFGLHQRRGLGGSSRTD